MNTKTLKKVKVTFPRNCNGGGADIEKKKKTRKCGKQKNRERKRISPRKGRKIRELWKTKEKAQNS